MASTTRHQTAVPTIARAALLGAVAVGILTGGCAHRRKTAPPVDPAALDDMGFQAYLADVPVVTVDEACRAMLILADGEDKTKSWPERREVLLRRGLIRAAWGLEPDNIADRGTIAYMACQILKIKGGVNRLILGSWGPGDRRYAYRELIYRGLMPAGSEWQRFTGGQMVSLMGKADEYMERKDLYETEVLTIGEEPKAETH